MCPKQYSRLCEVIGLLVALSKFALGIARKSFSYPYVAGAWPMNSQVHLKYISKCDIKVSRGLVTVVLADDFGG